MEIESETSECPEYIETMRNIRTAILMDKPANVRDMFEVGGEVVPWWHDALPEEVKARASMKLRKVPHIANSQDVLELCRAAILDFGKKVWHRYVCSLPGSRIPSQTPSHKELTAVCYKALINLQNNGAVWLGHNEKLTRLKLDAGVRVVLLLRLSYHQFDSFYRSFDASDNGSVTEHDFQLTIIEHYLKKHSVQYKHHFHKRVSDAIFDICESLEYHKLTLNDAFGAFDRTADDSVSVAEFTR